MLPLLQCIWTSWVRWGDPQLHSTPKVSLLHASVASGSLIYAPLLWDHVTMHDGGYFWTTLGDQVLHKTWQKVIHIWKGNATTWLLQHDNVPICISLCIYKFLLKHKMTTLLQSYSLDKFFLFPRIKTPPKRRHFDSIQIIQVVLTIALNAVPIDIFEGTYQEWLVCEKNV